MNKDIIIREYKNSDIPNIIDIYNDHYHTTRSLIEWQWEFEAGPLGQSIVVVAEYQTDLIGVSAQIPIPLSFYDRDLLCAKTEYSIVKNTFRGKGIFQLICQKSVDIARSNNISLLWGITYVKKAYERAGSGFLFPGRLRHLLLVINPYQTYHMSGDGLNPKKSLNFPFQQGWNLLFYTFLTGASLWSKIKRHRKANNSRYKIETISKVDDRLDYFWEAFRRQGNFYTIARTSNYLDWRIFKNPNMNHRLIAAVENNKIRGYIILGISGKQQGLGYVTDLCVLNSYEDTAGLLLSFAKEYFISESIAVVDAWSLGNNLETRKYLHYLKMFGFIPLPIGSSFLLNILTEKSNLSADPENINNWFLTQLFSEGIG